jgi:hypothetical protein
MSGLPFRLVRDAALLRRRVRLDELLDIKRSRYLLGTPFNDLFLLQAAVFCRPAVAPTAPS